MRQKKLAGVGVEAPGHTPPIGTRFGPPARKIDACWIKVRDEASTSVI